jgi:hypothetical protein
MKKKIHIYILSFLLLTLLFVMFSPLDYTNLTFSYFHFWLTIIYGVLVFVIYSENRKTRRTRIITSFIALPILALASFYSYIVSPNNELEFTPVPNSNLVVTNQFYTLFMMGNPRMDITIGYPLLGNQLIWNVNSYTKNGEGDPESELDKYELPQGIKKNDFGLFILEKERYLFVWGNNELYTVKKK